MILVLLGTHELSFKRLLECIEIPFKNGNLKEKVVVQAGNTKYKSGYLEIYDYIDSKVLHNFYEEADVIVTHGGVASITKGLNLKKKVIACPRLNKYNEHNDDHQVEIIEEYSKKGYILRLNDGDDFFDVYTKSKFFKFNEYKNSNIDLINFIKEYIDSI